MHMQWRNASQQAAADQAKVLQQIRDRDKLAKVRKRRAMRAAAKDN
jgi:hypothetical protein